MRKSINLLNIIIYVCSFFILLYPFNTSITEQIYKNYTIATLTVVFSISILLLLNLNRKITKSEIKIIIVTLFVFIIQIYDNYYIKEKRESLTILFSAFLIFPYVLSKNEKIIMIMQKVLKIFCIEHIIATFFAQFFRDIYTNIVLPWIANGNIIMAYLNVKQGYNPGLTTHYSTNGIYLSIAVIYFFSQFLNKRDKKNMIYSLIALIALLLTAKRAHLLFTVMSCVVLLLFSSRERVSSKIVKIIAIFIGSIITLMILSMFIPQILNVVTRFEEGSKSGDALNGRSEFYDLAIEHWKNHKLVGNGWGSFSYFYHIAMYNPRATYKFLYLGAHNVYLQMLCECGILGLLFFVLLATIMLYKTFRLLLLKNSTFEQPLLFSFCYQIFFVLYCFSGNPLYDIQCYSIYFMCFGITLYYLKKYKLLQLEKYKGEKNE